MTGRWSGGGGLRFCWVASVCEVSKWGRVGGGLNPGTLSFWVAGEGRDGVRERCAWVSVWRGFDLAIYGERMLVARGFALVVEIARAKVGE